MRNKLILPLLGVALVAAVIHPTSTVFAGSHTWSGAVNGNWSVAGNWSAGGAPVAGETDVRLTFPTGATRFSTTNNVGALSVNVLTLSGDNYTVRGNFALTLEGAVTHYCIERSGDPDDGEFKALVESAGLTGVTFKKVWSGGR